MTAIKSRPRDLREARRDRTHGCWGHLVAAPLWVAYEANLGTLLRTCEAVGACIAVPRTPHYRQAMDRGDTLVRRPHVHWVTPSKGAWIQQQRDQGWSIIAVELAEGSIPLTRVESARRPTIVLLGHERQGIPAEQVDEADMCIEVPMVGRGASLNVAVTGSLVLYRLAGLA